MFLCMERGCTSTTEKRGKTKEGDTCLAPVVKKRTTTIGELSEWRENV